MRSEAIWIVKILIIIPPFCLIPKSTPEFLPNTTVYYYTLKDKLSIPLIEKKRIGIHSERSCRCLIKVLGCAIPHHSPFPASYRDTYHDFYACLTFLRYIMKSWKAGMRSSRISSSCYVQHNSVYLVCAHPLCIDYLNDDLIKDFGGGSTGDVMCLPKPLFLLSLSSLAPWFTPGHSSLPKASYHPASLWKLSTNVKTLLLLFVTQSASCSLHRNFPHVRVFFQNMRASVPWYKLNSSAIILTVNHVLESAKPLTFSAFPCVLYMIAWPYIAWDIFSPALKSPEAGKVSWSCFFYNARFLTCRFV